MATENKNNLQAGKKEHNISPNQGRRKVLKALAGVPVVGALGIQVLRKSAHDKKTNLQQQIVNELGLEDLMDSIKPIVPSKGELVRLGIIGFGIRGPQLASALGFMEKSQFDRVRPGGTLDAQIKDGNFNVAITGVCDVYQKHLEKAVEVARHDIYTGGEIAKKHPVKAYVDYKDMLADENIDAIIIATPDHHHAQMTIDAIKAGKHVYCEKSFIHREEEVYAVYDEVKNSDRVFQMGHQYPQNSVFQQAREIIKRGMLGKITHVETSTNRNTPQGAWIRHLDADGNPKPMNEKDIDWKRWLGKAPEVPFSVRRYYSWARYFDYETGLYGQLFSHEYDAVNQLLDIGIPSKVVATGGQYVYNEFGQLPDMLHTLFEYPNHGLTLTYSSNLASSKYRPRTLYGMDASMTVGGNLSMTPDGNSTKYKKLLQSGAISPNSPMIEISKGSQLHSAVDAVSSATTRYYAQRGLTSTNVDGREWDVTHLHLKEWIDCIRNGSTPSSNIEKAFVEGITLAMADISYREQCITQWNPKERKITRT